MVIFADIQDFDWIEAVSDSEMAQIKQAIDKYEVFNRQRDPKSIKHLGSNQKICEITAVVLLHQVPAIYVSKHL